MAAVERMVLLILALPLGAAVLLHAAEEFLKFRELRKYRR